MRILKLNGVSWCTNANTSMVAAFFILPLYLEYLYSRPLKYSIWRQVVQLIHEC